MDQISQFQLWIATLQCWRACARDTGWQELKGKVTDLEFALYHKSISLEFTAMFTESGGRYQSIVGSFNSVPLLCQNTYSMCPVLRSTLWEVLYLAVLGKFSLTVPISEVTDLISNHSDSSIIVGYIKLSYILYVKKIILRAMGDYISTYNGGEEERSLLSVCYNILTEAHKLRKKKHFCLTTMNRTEKKIA